MDVGASTQDLADALAQDTVTAFQGLEVPYPTDVGGDTVVIASISATCKTVSFNILLPIQVLYSVTLRVVARLEELLGQCV